MVSISTLSFVKSRLFNVKFHFDYKISFIKSRIYVKSRFVKSRINCS